MGLIKSTIKKEIDSANTQKYSIGTATISAYDETTNTACINYNDPNGGGIMHREGVPVIFQVSGVFGNALCPGTRVSISFINGNVFSPVITGMIGSEYSRMNTLSTGGSVLSSKAQSAKIPDKIIPMNEQWFDFDNDDEYKYINQYSNKYYESDCDEAVYEITRMSSHYSPNDRGIINTCNGSMIMITESGDIDVFIDEYTGIKISKEDHKIYLYGLEVANIVE